jgi:hypothetical protein
LSVAEYLDRRALGSSARFIAKIRGVGPYLEGMAVFVGVLAVIAAIWR